MGSTLPDVASPSEKPQRLLSLDALRGFDMFWIIGGEAIVHEAARVCEFPPVQLAAGQLRHEPWAGFAFYDLIFPMFVFLVGVSIVFSLTKAVAVGGRTRALRRVIVRTFTLLLLGILYYGGLSGRYDSIRLVGVLQRIAIAYFFASLMFLYLSPRGIAIVTAGILIGYWALLSFVPVPGVGHASFEERKNWSDYIDSQYLPLRKYNGDHDPEGLLSTLPAICSATLGLFAGLLLRDNSRPPTKKAAILFIAGAISVAIGFTWGLQFPVIKRLWTSTFVLVAGGYSAMLLATFYLVIDVWNQKWWTWPFVWIGMNAITLYLIDSVFDFGSLAERFVGGQFRKQFLPEYGSLVTALVATGIMLLLARFLYRRQIFLRV